MFSHLCEDARFLLIGSRDHRSERVLGVVNLHPQKLCETCHANRGVILCNDADVVLEDTKTKRLQPLTAALREQLGGMGREGEGERSARREGISDEGGGSSGDGDGERGVGRERKGGTREGRKVCERERE